MNALADYDFAVMVLTPDDLLNIRGESHKTPRDNVLFELGLLMGHLGRDRTLIVSERGAELKLPSDLDGITRITFRRRDNLAAAVSPACTKLTKRIRELGPFSRRGSRQADEGFLKATYPRSQHPAFFAEIEHLVPRAKTIVLIATGLNLIWEEHILDILLDRAKSGEAKVTICMANPYSPHILDRLIEEEMGGKRAPVGRHGIERNTKALIQKVAGAGNPRAMRVCLFEHYPTFATLIFDDDIYVYLYAYQLLGTASPIFHFRDDGTDEARFFVENSQRILRDAVPAVDVISSHSDRRYYSKDWIGAALYAIPDAGDPFYLFGSSIIGYDVRAEKPVDSGAGFADLQPAVGDAEEYGFHATLADALYFSSEAQLDRIRAELEFVAEDFPAFDLSNLRVADTLPNEESIIVLCDDATGVAEAIHHELVSRVYSTCISSQYLTGRIKKKLREPKAARDRLMLDRYGSPNILRQLVLHFTLLSSPPHDPAERGELIVRIQSELEHRVPSGRVEINELCLMVRRNGDTHWTILDRFPLSSR
jgi:hypothetical protein